MKGGKCSIGEFFHYIKKDKIKINTPVEPYKKVLEGKTSQKLIKMQTEKQSLTLFQISKVYA